MTTTFKTIRPLIAAQIKALTPDVSPELKFVEIVNTDTLENLPIDFSLTRKFELESGGIQNPPGVFTQSLYRDTRKELTVKVGYMIGKNLVTIRDMADEDENQIIRLLENPDNIATVGAWNIELDNTRHLIEDARRIVYLNFRVHFNHSA